MPLVTASAIISAATPAVTPATEIAVTTPTTAWRRLAFRYRAAMKNSNRILNSRATSLGGSRESGLCYADIFKSVIDAHGQQMFSRFVAGDLQTEVVVLLFRVRQFAHRSDKLPCPCIQRVLGMRDRRCRVCRLKCYVDR